MHFLTDFGDEIILLPLAAATLVWLAALAGRRAAVMWAAAVLICAGGTALLKIYLGTCGAPIDALVSPSGHASMSTLVYGSLALIVGAETLAWQRIAIAAFATAMVVGIALSRVIVGAHTTIEVVIGLVIGGVALGVFARSYLATRPAHAQVWPLLAAAVIIALVLHGHALSLEGVLHAIGGYLHLTAGLCA